MKSTNQNWHDIWSKKGVGYSDKSLSMYELLALSGYDSGSDGISLKRWENWVNEIINELPVLTEISSWTDLGCGSGCFLFSLPKSYKKIGYDYSSSLIEIATRYSKKENMSNEFHVADMSSPEFNFESSDLISLVSSLQYISKDSAKVLMKKCFEKANMGVLVAETPDAKHIIEANRYRNETLNYVPTLELQHSYLDSDFFDELAHSKNFEIIELQSKLGKQSVYRWSRFYLKRYLND